MLRLGLDLGTTTVSGVVMDTSTGNVLAARTRKNSADILSPIPGEKCQDPMVLVRVAEAMLEELLALYPQVSGIGITGQMHGIVYLDGEGNCVSPLYTWQDQRSASLCPQLTKRTGYWMAPGYGLATHYALMRSGQIPPRAEKICTIMDYLAFLLCGKQKLLMHASNAASLGMFSLESGCFDTEALKSVGIDPEWLPSVTGKTAVQGYYRGIPVAVAIGDNQASFLGSVPSPETTVLVNFGTGSQISRMVRAVPELGENSGVEVRPYLENSWLLCGSALCGGRAYALLEGFFRQFLNRSGNPAASCYDTLNQLAMEGLARQDLPEVEPTFCGTRQDPGKRGSILMLGEENFTPAAMAGGLLLGMAEELRQLLPEIPGEALKAVVASGNAVRKNPALVQAVSRVFGLPVTVPENQEEAACGAARFAKAAEKMITDL